MDTNYQVNFSQEFREWWNDLDRDLKKTLLKNIGLLQEYGHELSRPYADTLEGSSLSNLKELRVNYKRNPYRLLYAFDPKREALLLIGGNKATDKKWYERMIPKAEAIFAAHLKALEDEDKDESTTH